MSTSALSRPNTALSGQQERAARLVAIGGKGVEEIATELGVGRRTLWKWSKLPEFKARVRHIDAELDAEVYRTGLAKRRNRLDALDELAGKLKAAIGRSAKPNPALVAQYLRTLEQIAREMGQWTERLDMTVERIEQVQVREVIIELDTGGNPELVEQARAYLNGEVTEADWRPAHPLTKLAGEVVDEAGPVPEDEEEHVGTVAQQRADRAKLVTAHAERMAEAEGRRRLTSFGR